MPNRKDAISATFSINTRRERRKGIPAARRLEAALKSGRSGAALGELAIGCFAGLFESLRTFVVDGVRIDPSLHGFLVAFDRITARATAFLEGLPPHLKAELGVAFTESGELDIYLAYDQHLRESGSTTDDDEKKEKAKKL